MAATCRRASHCSSQEGARHATSALGDEAHVAPVTLVVAVHGDVPQLQALLSAIAEQVVCPAELLVADRGSTGGTAQLLSGWSPPLLPSFKVVDAAGTSVAEARNLAIESASYEWVVVTEAAARPEPDWIARLWAALIDGAEVASGVNLAITRSAWDEVGGYPEWLEAGHDEVFAAALRGAGTTIVDVPEAVVTWSPGRGLAGFAADGFRTARACGQAELSASPAAVIAATLLAGGIIRRSLGLGMAGAVLVRSQRVLRSVWRSRGHAVDPLGVRTALTVGVQSAG